VSRERVVERTRAETPQASRASGSSSPLPGVKHLSWHRSKATPPASDRLAIVDRPSSAGAARAERAATA